jgi:hypothetical protein
MQFKIIQIILNGGINFDIRKEIKNANIKLKEIPIEVINSIKMEQIADHKNPFPNSEYRAIFINLEYDESSMAMKNKNPYLRLYHVEDNFYRDIEKHINHAITKMNKRANLKYYKAFHRVFKDSEDICRHHGFILFETSIN